MLGQIAGIFIILTGLHFLGLFPFGFLNREARYHHKTRPAGLLGAYAVGLAFAFGWTPCIGPVLATILAVAASEESVGQGRRSCSPSIRRGSAFRSCWRRSASTGSSASCGAFPSTSARSRRSWAGLLVLAGIGFLTGFHQRLAYWLLETFPGFATFG